MVSSVRNVRLPSVINPGQTIPLPYLSSVSLFLLPSWFPSSYFVSLFPLLESRIVSHGHASKDHHMLCSYRPSTHQDVLQTPELTPNHGLSYDQFKPREITSRVVTVPLTHFQPIHFAGLDSIRAQSASKKPDHKHAVPRTW